tara:strand:+ start:348 stop:644 length:297 start_codon:yes stop_codon:yes gene_type:complete
MERGDYFGYPKCCQDFFYQKRMLEKNLTLLPNQKYTSNGKGFIPCPKCADYLVENNLKIVYLIKNRICPHPFPTSYCYTLECSCKKPPSILKKYNKIY